MVKNETNLLPETDNTPTLRTEITPPPRASAIAHFEKGFSLNIPTVRNPETALPAGPTQVKGATWGSYELLQPLGQGAMGRVYEARDTMLDRHVALKILSADRTDDCQNPANSCLHEARIAAKLDNPNIVAIYQVGEHDGFGFIAMQLVRGTSAATDLPLSVEKSIHVVRAIAIALRYAHNQGLVHRDVKPENLLLGDDGSVKLADFGLAQVISNGSCRAVSDRVAGTPAFMSPEQAQGLPLDGRSDLYSLGATWFMLLTGQVPYKGKSFVEVLSAHIEQAAPDVRSIRPDVPQLIAALIARLLSKKPEDRPASAEELLAAIDATPLTTQLTKRAARFSRVARWALAASLIGGPIGLAMNFRLSATPPDNRDQHEFALVSTAPETPKPVLNPESSGGCDDSIDRDDRREVIAPRMAEPTAPTITQLEIKPVEKALTATPVSIENSSETANAMSSTEPTGSGQPVRIPPSLLGTSVFSSSPASNPSNIPGFSLGLAAHLKRPPIPAAGKIQVDPHYYYRK